MRNFAPIVLMVSVLVVSMLMSASLGAAQISFSQVVSSLQHGLLGDEAITLTDKIIFELRLPRILLALLAGAGLSMAGAALQTVTKNPLADPYLFGISSGASLGAVVFITLSSGLLSSTVSSNLIGELGLSISAFFGAALSMILVLTLSLLKRSQQIETMLLAGVAVSFLCGSVSSLLLYFSAPDIAANILFWSLGSFTKASWDLLTLPSIVVVSALIALFVLTPWISVLQLGDESAQSLGISVTKLRLAVLLICSVVTAVLVAACGGIAFVGLMIPHVVRLVLQSPPPFVYTALLGAIFMIWVDVIARCLIDNQELPVGIITAVIGSVFFIIILFKKSSKS
ncbi:MAG: FecCD family ABC transporter permease [Parashewanella sp.]